MDAWWPELVRAQFQPALGKKLFTEVEDRVIGLGGFGWDWASHVQKDLRSVLGKEFKGASSQIYCGGPVTQPAGKPELAEARSRCAEILVTTLETASEKVAEAQGNPDPAQWTVPATCEIEEPAICDQIVPSTAGAVDTPPFPWQNRGTYHQVDEVEGQR